MRDTRLSRPAIAEAHARAQPSPLQLVHQLALARFTTAEEWRTAASIFERRGLQLGFAEQLEDAAA